MKLFYSTGYTNRNESNRKFIILACCLHLQPFQFFTQYFIDCLLQHMFVRVCVPACACVRTCLDVFACMFVCLVI